MQKQMLRILALSPLAGRESERGVLYLEELCLTRAAVTVAPATLIFRNIKTIICPDFALWNSQTK